MFRLLAGEEFKEINIDYPLKLRYAVSNRGRLVSFSDIIRTGTILKGSVLHGFMRLRYKMVLDGKISNKQLYVHKLVAENFIPKTAEDQNHVLHIDYDSGNNHASNLKWSNYTEKIEHFNKSPKVLRARQELIEYNTKADGRKLTTTKVIHLKKLINDPNRKTRFKILAKQFGISEMQLYRIKNGENWAHIKV